MRLLPKNRWRLAILLAAGAVAVAARYWVLKNQWCLFHPKVLDEAGLLARKDACWTDAAATAISRESGVDIRFLFTNDVGNQSLENFSLERARQLGLGKETGRRGLLFVYDVPGRRMRIEVGPKLEGIFPDGFLGYLIRQNMRDFFASGNPGVGIRATLYMVQHRIRESVLGREFDPRVEEYIADVKRLAVGGGATAAVVLGRDSSGFLNREADSVAKRYFGPQPTVEEAYRRWLEWLALDAKLVDVPLFTGESQEWLRDLPITRAFGDFLLSAEYDRAYTIDERGSLALLYYTNDPIVPPHLFRKTKAGWQLDGLSEVLNFPNLVGYPYAWYWHNTNDEYNLSFADRIVMEGRVPRILGGDNRPLPVHGRAWYDVINELRHPWGQLPVRVPPKVDTLSVNGAAEKIRAARGKPAFVVFYWSTKEFNERLFPSIVQAAQRLHGTDATFLVFSTEDPEYTQWISWLFERYPAPFDPLYVRPWASGDFFATFAPMGIVDPVGESWNPPLVAVLGRDGSVMLKGQGVTDLAPFTRELERAAKQ